MNVLVSSLEHFLNTLFEHFFCTLLQPSTYYDIQNVINDQRQSHMLDAPQKIEIT